MIPNRRDKIQRRYPDGARVRVIQDVRVGGKRWTTEVVGTVVNEGRRPVGGMEMGSKAAVAAQPTITLRGPDGEITTIAIDESTRVETL